MVILTTPLLTAIAVLSAVTSAAPSFRQKRDSSTNEPAFSAPNGVIESTVASPTPVVAGSSNYGSNYGSSGSNSYDSGSSNSYNSGSSGNSWNSGSDNSYDSGSYNSASNNYGSSSDNSYQGSNYNQGSNSWDSVSSDTWSSSDDSWTSTSTADSSWQTSYVADNSWETTTTSADDSWQTNTWSADNSWQTTSQTTWVATTTVEAVAATQSSWSGSSGSYGSSGSSYGSGSSNWGTDYNSCVSQCQAQWNQLPPPSTTTAPPSYNGGSSWDSGSSNGSPTTHTVIVAPTQGVLRYIPFAINASVGDTISWQWHAGPHTVTKSSESTPCNKTLDNPFASGQQNASFVFNQVINDTSPVFYYCGVPNHCEKGMFGIVNAPTTFSIDTSLESEILAQAAANPTMGAMVAMVNNMTTGTSAYSWGSQMDTSVVPEGYMQNFIENALYTRLFYAANNGSLESGQGAFSPSGSLVFPNDLPVLMATANAANGTSSGSSSSAAPAPSGGSSSGAYGASMSTSGARHVVVSGGFLAVAIAVGALLA